MSPKEIRENKLALAKTDACKEIFREKIREVNAEILALRAIAEVQHQYAMTIKDEEQYQLFIAIAFFLIQKHEAELKLKRRRWDRLLSPYVPSASDKLFDLDVIRLQVSIAELIDTPPKIVTEERATFSCPFHKEKTASFVVFKKDNHFHCFGCQKHGDLITFVMSTNACTFIKACQYISGL